MKRTIGLLLTIIALLAFAACEKSHTHSFGEWEIIKNPTCTEDGEKEQTCACGEKQTTVVSKTGHNVAKIDAVKETCTTAGSTMGTYCTSCGEIIEKPETILASHKYDDGKITIEATCSTEGERIFTCSVCNDTIKENMGKIAHNFETKITKEATCAEVGEKTNTCTVCNEVTVETIPRLTIHTYDQGEITKEATCTESGEKTVTCKICKSTRTVSIDALDHNLKNNTCTRCGYFSLELTSEEIAKSRNVDGMKHYVSDYSDEIVINISFKDKDGYNARIPVCVDVKIVDSKDKTLYQKTLVKKTAQSSVTIPKSDIKKGYSETGTISYKVYNDYIWFDVMEEELDDLPWTLTVKLPSLPQTIKKYSYSGSLESSCKVTKITYECSGDDLYVYLTGQKTYDSDGSNYSSSCKIGWKLYDEDGYVIDDGNCYTSSLTTGEKFKDERITIYDAIEK